MKKLLVAIMSSVFTVSAVASTIGVSNHPFAVRDHVITTEFNNYASAGSGMGLSANYLRRINESINMNAGFGITDGSRASRFIVGSNIRILPDYGRQPMVSVKGTLETENIDGDRINSFGVAPTISKGLVLWGKEAYPYLALPLRVSLNTNESTYETSTALAAGISGRVPWLGARDLVGNIETNISLRNSYAALMMGVSLPIE